MVVCSGLYCAATCTIGPSTSLYTTAVDSYVSRQRRISSTMKRPPSQYWRIRHHQHLCSLVLLWLLLLAAVSVATSSNTSPSTELLQEELLKFLGMKMPMNNNPAPTTKVPAFMQQYYKNQQMLNYGSENNDDHHDFNIKQDLPPVPDSVRCIANVTEIGDVSEVRAGVGRIRIKFGIDGMSSKERLHSAQLRVTHSPRSSQLSPDYESGDNHPNSVMGDFKDHSLHKYKKDQLPYVNYIRVYDIVRILDDGDTVLRLLDTALVDRREKGVLILDVGPAVERWVSKPHTNNGLVLEMDPYHKNTTARSVDMSHLRMRRDADTDDNKWHEERPFVVVYSDDGKPKQRVKRAKPSAPNSRCQRHSLYVDFKLVHWGNWIVAPGGYHAYFCDGECEYPIAEHLNTTNHAIVQTLVNSHDPNRVPKACCIPTELSPISMLYFDEFKDIVIKNYQNMVVQACGCR